MELSACITTITVAYIMYIIMYFRAVATPTPDQPNSLASTFMEYTSCLQHRSLVLTMSAIIQAITVQCPGALVWQNLGEGKTNSILYGSPLDLLPCAPSSLPMAVGADNQQVGKFHDKETQKTSGAIWCFEIKALC